MASTPLVPCSVLTVSYTFCKTRSMQPVIQSGVLRRMHFMLAIVYRAFYKSLRQKHCLTRSGPSWAKEKSTLRLRWSWIPVTQGYKHWPLKHICSYWNVSSPLNTTEMRCWRHQRISEKFWYSGVASLIKAAGFSVVSPGGCIHSLLIGYNWKMICVQKMALCGNWALIIREKHSARAVYR